MYIYKWYFVSFQAYMEDHLRNENRLNKEWEVRMKNASIELESSPLIKENSACAAIAQANLYNNDLPARSKFILLTKLHDVTLVLIEIWM